MNLKSVKQIAVLLLIAGLWVMTAQGQSNVDRVAVPLSDPAQPVRLNASILNGSISVKTHAGRNVIVEARVRNDEGDEPTRGKKRVLIAATGLTVEEDNNEVRVSADSNSRTIDLNILAPLKTSVTLKSVNDGNIVVSGVDGEIDVDNVNGDVTLQDVSGYAVAHALNGELKVSFRAIDPQKPMAFSSLNGDIEVAFPPTLKANVSLTSESGDVFSDFDISMQQNAPKQIVEDARGKGGKFRVRIDKTLRGTINGGGQDIQFKNFNGSIYIRRAATVTAPVSASPTPKGN